MSPTVFVQTADSAFGHMLCGTLKAWSIWAMKPDADIDQLAGLARGEIDIVLLDIRERLDEAMHLLRWLRKNAPEVEVILLNTTDRVSASMAAMREGAADELSIPLDTDALRKKIMAASRRRRAPGRQRRKKSLLGRLEKSMAAASFAQAGEPGMALEILDEERTDGDDPEKPGP